MPKRFTDSDKWADDWFMSLNNEDKIIWLYLLDNCDHAGIWKPNEKLLQFMCQTKKTLEKVKDVLSSRVMILDNGKWMIPKFLKFQYPQGLDSQMPAIKSVLKILNDNAVDLTLMEQLCNSCQRVQDKDMDMDMDVDNEIKGDYKGEIDLLNGRSENFKSAFYGFREMRKKKRNPLTHRAEELILKKLVGLASDEATQIEILDQSTQNGWASVYELKKKQSMVLVV